MRVSLKIIIILLFVCFPVVSQISETSPGKYFLFKHYSTENGLLDDVIYNIAQDKYGYIWMGSNIGLTRFDGKTFYHQAIPEINDHSAFVQNVVTTASGNIIATGFMQGVFVQQEDGRFKHYLEKGYYVLGQNIFQVVKPLPDNSLLAAYQRALFVIRGDSIQKLFDNGASDGLFFTIDCDKEDRVWFGGRLGLGILHLSDTVNKPLFFPELKNKFINRIRFDAEGTLHIATTQGYYRIKWKQPSSWDSDYVIEQPFHSLKDVSAYSLYLDKEQYLWIGTTTYGVYRTKGDSVILHLTKENGLSSNTVSCIMQDREGNYWIGTNNGVNIAKDFDNLAIAINGVRYEDAIGMEKDAFQRLWINSKSAALHLYQQDKMVPVSLQGTPFEKSGISFLKIDGSILWITNLLGLYKMPITEALPDLRKVEKVVDYPSHNITRVRSLFIDDNGVWVCSQNKMFNYFNNRFLPVTFNHADSASRSPSSMVQDNYGFYWYGDYNYGIYRGKISRPDSHRMVFDSLTVYKSIKPDSSFVTAWIQNMLFDKAGHLWYSTEHTGVYQLVIDSVGVVSSKLYSTKNGLLSNNVQHISCDDSGKMWLMTVKGINILQYDSLGVESVVKFNVNEGISGTGIHPLLVNDRLFLLTYGGVYNTQNQLVYKKTETRPNVILTNLLINGVADSERTVHTDHLRLEHGQNNITIEYAVIAYRNIDDVRYQYKLEGASDDWSVLSDRGFVEFAYLRPGKYTFKVRAAMLGAETEVGREASLSFRILPAYYQTVWFYVLIAIFIFGLFYIFYQNRINHAVKMERMRMRIASDLHDDVGSTLSSISLISEMATRKDKEAEWIKALSKIGIDSRDVLNSMDDIIWSVNPQNDSLANLVTRLREYAIPVCESAAITFIINVEESIYALKLGMDERRNIYLITKEAINNAVKYAGCSLLSVAFVLIHKQLEVTITDNGCGFDPSKRGLRNGLTNMERRAKQIGMALSIKSEKNKGAIISLHPPAPFKGGRKAEFTCSK